MREWWHGDGHAPSTLVVGLLAEGASLGELGLAAGGASQLGLAAVALNLRGGVAVHDSDGHAVGALHVHEVGVGALDETAALVLLALVLDVGVRKVGVEKAHGD